MDDYSIFTAYGGSGSSFLARELGLFVRPDAWQPPFRGQPLTAWETRDGEPRYLLGPDDYDRPAVAWDRFNLRTDGVYEHLIDHDVSIRQNLGRFCHWIATTEHRVLFAHAGIMGLFSQARVENVTFLVRHPLQSLASFAKAERHGVEVEALGGLESDMTVELWADRWNRHAREFLDCRRLGLGPVLVRYEYAPQDSMVSPLHERVFAGLDSTRRNPCPLSTTRAHRLRDLVADSYFRLYESWDLE